MRSCGFASQVCFCFFSYPHLYWWSMARSAIRIFCGSLKQKKKINHVLCLSFLSECYTKSQLRNLLSWDTKKINKSTDTLSSQTLVSGGTEDNNCSPFMCLYLLCQPPRSPFILRLSVLWPEDESGQQYCQLRPQAVSKSHSFKRSFCSA